MNKILILFLSLLPCAAVFCQDSLPVIPDEEYRLACGPIAGLIALESLGVATDLPEIASRCHSLNSKEKNHELEKFLICRCLCRPFVFRNLLCLGDAVGFAGK